MTWGVRLLSFAAPWALRGLVDARRAGRRVRAGRPSAAAALGGAPDGPISRRSARRKRTRASGRH